MRKGAGHLEAVERVKDWTRERFRLGAAETVLLQESPCALPGFPPTEILVAFWTAAGERHHFKVFKPVEAVTEEDLPPSWMKDSLAGDIACECC
jgi:nitrate reductase delta subunit